MAAALQLSINEVYFGWAEKDGETEMQDHYIIFDPKYNDRSMVHIEPMKAIQIRQLGQGQDECKTYSYDDALSLVGFVMEQAK